jgi:hypothetical protein
MALPTELEARMKLLEQQCNFRAVRKGLGREDYAAVTAELRRALGQITGGSDPEENAQGVNLLLVVCHYDFFYGLMQRLGCDLGDSYEAREALCADFSQWKETGMPGEGEWLVFAQKQRPEAVAACKKRLFSAMEALLLPVTDFCDVPAPGMKAPRWVRKPYEDFEIVTIEAELTDDGGLFSDPHPNGKSFLLTDADGAVYHLNGVRVTDAQHAEMQSVMFEEEPVRSFAAMGTIEGYTGPQRREIELTLLPDGTAAVSYSTQSVDDSEAENDPRWGGYAQWADARIAARRAYQEQLIAALTEA